MDGTFEFHCDSCLSGKTVKRRQLNTRYENEEDNFKTSCRECFEKWWEYYHELWTANVGGGSPFSSEPPVDEE